MAKKEKEKETKVPDLVKNKTKPEDFSVNFLLTGNVAFDIAVSDGRGVPIGAFIMISSPKGAGKTTLTLDILTRLLNKYHKENIPDKFMYIDIEGSRELASSFGLKEFIESGNLIHYTGQVTYSKLEALYNAIIKKQEEVKDIKFIIIDSIAGVTTESMVTKDVEAAHFGLTAKAATEFFTKFTPLCIEHGITTIMINHEAVEQGVQSFVGPVKKEKGSDSAKYMSTVLLRLSKKQGGNDADIKKREVKTIHGSKEVADKFLVIIKSPDKNRYCRLGEVEMLVKAGKRVLNYYIIREILENRGLIKKSGNFWIIDDEIALDEVKDKKLTRKEVNKYIDNQEEPLIEYLRDNNMYTYKIELDNEDDDY